MTDWGIDTPVSPSSDCGMRRSTPANGRALPVVRDDPTNTTS